MHRDQKQQKENPCGTSERHQRTPSDGHRPWLTLFGVSAMLLPWSVVFPGPTLSPERLV